MRKIKYKYNDDDLKKAITSSISIRETLKKLKVSPSGANYILIYKKIKELNLNTMHFLGQGHLKGKSHNFSIKIPLKEILIMNSTYTNTNALRKRLIKENILKEKCSNCELEYWCEEKIPLELDHINGKRNDNRIENLRILCRMCHGLTSNFAGKNIGCSSYSLNKC
jgi:hypothetical protein